jgi:hypothetical protein
VSRAPGTDPTAEITNSTQGLHQATQPCLDTRQQIFEIDIEKVASPQPKPLPQAPTSKCSGRRCASAAIAWYAHPRIAASWGPPPPAVGASTCCTQGAVCRLISKHIPREYYATTITTCNLLPRLHKYVRCIVRCPSANRPPARFLQRPHHRIAAPAGAAHSRSRHCAARRRQQACQQRGCHCLELVLWGVLDDPHTPLHADRTKAARCAACRSTQRHARTRSACIARHRRAVGLRACMGMHDASDPNTALSRAPLIVLTSPVERTWPVEAGAEYACVVREPLGCRHGAHKKLRRNRVEVNSQRGQLGTRCQAHATGEAAAPPKQASCSSVSLTEELDRHTKDLELHTTSSP